MRVHIYERASSFFRTAWVRVLVNGKSVASVDLERVLVNGKSVASVDLERDDEGCPRRRGEVHQRPVRPRRHLVERASRQYCLS